MDAENFECWPDLRQKFTYFGNFCGVDGTAWNFSPKIPRNAKIPFQTILTTGPTSILKNRSVAQTLVTLLVWSLVLMYFLYGEQYDKLHTLRYILILSMMLELTPTLRCIIIIYSLFFIFSKFSIKFKWWFWRLLRPNFLPFKS